MKNAIHGGASQFFFPDYPNHPLNGCYAHAVGPFFNGTKIRGIFCIAGVDTYEDNEHNRTNDPKNWTGVLTITAADFPTWPVKVKFVNTESYPALESFFFIVPELNNRYQHATESYFNK